MRPSQFFSIIALCAALASPATAGREAKLLSFEAAVPVEVSRPRVRSGEFAIVPHDVALGLNPFTELSLDRRGIAAVMRSEFERSLDAAPIDLGIDLDNLPTKGLFIPRWMQPRARAGIRTIGQLPGFATTALASGSFAHCDGASYAPTWWLDRRVEQRRAFYFESVSAVACEFGVPTALLDAVIAQESGYKYWVVSPAGAMGMMQIMPGTARGLGLNAPFDVMANLRAGARYLRQQLDRFGRVDLALAAYNAGPHRESLRQGRVPMISETLNYVATITQNWERMTPRVPIVATVDRGALAAAVVSSTRFRTVQLASFDRAGLR